MKTSNLKTNRNYILLTKLIYIILFLWFMVSVLRTGFNFTKIATDKDFFSDPLRKQKLKYFGVNQVLVERLNSDTTINKVLLLNEEGTISYFYLRYNLYPKEIFNKLSNVNYDAIVIFEPENKRPNISQSLLENYPKSEKITLDNNRSAYLYTK